MNGLSHTCNMYPFLPKACSHPGWHIPLSRIHVLYNRFLLIIHFRNHSVYMTFPKSLTIPFPLETMSSFSKSVSLFLFRK